MCSAQKMKPRLLGAQCVSLACPPSAWALLPRLDLGQSRHLVQPRELVGMLLLLLLLLRLFHQTNHLSLVRQLEPLLRVALLGPLLLVVGSFLRPGFKTDKLSSLSCLQFSFYIKN